VDPSFLILSGAIVDDLPKFLDLIFGDSDGYVYAAVKELSGKFSQHYFKWPDSKGDVEFLADNAKDKGEVYFCPSIFKSPSGQKADVLGSRVAWVDFDYGVPETYGEIPRPNIVVRTSGSDHIHAYWNLNTFQEPNAVEELNRRLAYNFEADTSGWDCNQLLRLPGTRNHKRGADVVLLQARSASFAIGAFTSLPQTNRYKANKPIEEILANLPNVSTILLNYHLPPKLRRLLTTPVEEGKRSSAIMALAYGLAEIGLKDGEILALLIEADSVHQKFVGRPDKHTRLMEAVGRAREKVTNSGETSSGGPLALKTLTEVLSGQTTLEWVWAPYVYRRGSMVLSGPPGVGKSQFALALQQSLVLGTEFLGMKPEISGLRVGFLSLEMDQVELQYILRAQTNSYGTDEMQLLESNALFLPLGHPLNFTDKENQDQIRRLVSDNELDGLIIDSLSATTPKELAGEEEAKRLFDFDAVIRQTFGIFTLYIHHNRKAQSDNRKPVKLSDLHGSVHLAGKAGTVVFLWPEPNGEVSVISPKVRLSAPPAEFRTRRTPHLRLERIKGNESLTVMVKGEEVYKENADTDAGSDKFDGGTGSSVY